MYKGALFNKVRTHRFILWRIWNNSKPMCMFIGLNGSRADENTNDPTVTRCQNYAMTWEYGGLYMANAFSLMSTNPAKLYSHPEPNLPDNDAFIRSYAERSGIVIAAWGNHGAFQNRGKDIIRMGLTLHCLGTTKTGQPKHPLYLKADLQPTLFCSTV